MAKLLCERKWTTFLGGEIATLLEGGGQNAMKEPDCGWQIATLQVVKSHTTDGKTAAVMAGKNAS